MIDIARRHGSHAKFSGSGGAVIPTYALIDHLFANLARSGAVESALLVTNDRYHEALRDHLAAGAPTLPTRVISDGTSSEDQGLGALGDLQLALRRRRAGAATDNLLALDLRTRWAAARRTYWPRY